MSAAWNVVSSPVWLSVTGTATASPAFTVLSAGIVSVYSALTSFFVTVTGCSAVKSPYFTVTLVIPAVRASPFSIV